MAAWRGHDPGEVKENPPTRPERRVEGGEDGGGNRMMAGSKQSGLWDDVEQSLKLLTLALCKWSCASQIT